MGYAIPPPTTLVDYPFVTLPANAALQLLATNPRRVWWSSHSRSGNGNGANAQVRYGATNTIGLAKGGVLQNGETVRVETQSALFAFAGAAGQIVAIQELVR